MKSTDRSLAPHLRSSVYLEKPPFHWTRIVLTIQVVIKLLSRWRDTRNDRDIIVPRDIIIRLSLAQPPRCTLPIQVHLCTFLDKNAAFY